MRVTVFSVAILSAVASSALAQKSGTGVSTAPGMPLAVGQRASTPYNSAKILPPTPRFWRKPDSTAFRHAQALSLLVARRTGLPTAFLLHKDYTIHAKEDISIKLHFLAIIQPNGSVSSAELQKQTGDKEHAYSPESIALLVAEGKRAIKTLKFEPAATQDTLKIPLRFRL